MTVYAKLFKGQRPQRNKAMVHLRLSTLQEMVLLPWGSEGHAWRSLPERPAWQGRDRLWFHNRKL